MQHDQYQNNAKITKNNGNKMKSKKQAPNENN